MSCARQDIQVIRGVTKTLRLSVIDDDGDAVDLAGATVYFRAKEAIGDASAVISKSSAQVSEIEILTPTTGGQADIKLAPSDTATLNLVPHVYDVWVQLASGDRHAVVKPARLYLERAVTEL